MNSTQCVLIRSKDNVLLFSGPESIWMHLMWIISDFFLQVWSEGQWIEAVPIAGTILVNVGEIMQYWTSDRYMATVNPS